MTDNGIAQPEGRMMDKPKWTEGEWYISGVDHAGQAIVNGPHYEICTCWHHSVGSIEQEMFANAHLISAATALAKAAEPFAKAFEGLQGDPDTMALDCFETRLTVGHVRALAAAYRKALGET